MTNRLAQLLTIRVASAAMDQYVRTAILEGIADVGFGKWGRRPNGLALAEAALGDRLDPEWFSRRDMGVYKAAYLSAYSVLKNRESAEELVAALLAGDTRSRQVHGGQLYDVGVAISSDATPDLGKAKAYISRHIRGRAIAMLRKKAPSSLTMEDEDGGTTVLDVPTNVDRDSVIDGILSFLASPSGGSILRKILQVLKVKWARAPGKVAIFEAMLEHPEYSDVQVARFLRPGVPDSENSWIQGGGATYVSRIRREVRQEIPKIVQDIPGLLRDVDLAEELSGLGYGTGTSSRWARMAKNLAHLLRAG